MNLKKFTEALEQKQYRVKTFESGKEAAGYLNQSLDGLKIGMACSATMQALGLYESLSAHNAVCDPARCESDEEFLERSKECLSKDVFLVTVNAAAETGEFVNLDATGNRLAGSLFGCRKVCFLVTENKVVPTLEEAIARARNVAGPEDAQRMGLDTPCAKEGCCSDCSCADRICNAMTVYFRKMEGVEEAEVLVIQEAMGF